VQEAAVQSAELNALARFYKGDLSGAPNDLHHLLYTDTWLGRSSAEILSAWLQGRGVTSVLHCVKDLQTGDIESFHMALAEIALLCSQTFPGYRAAGYRVVFNLNGGFKSVQGFLQTLGMFYADEIVYIFESGRDLLRIPRLPVVLAEEDAIRMNLCAIRRLASGLKPESRGRLPELFFIRIGDDLMLSPWGQLMWDQARESIYREKVHPPCSKKIRFSPGFEADTAALPPERKVMVNTQVDRLAVCLENPGDNNLNSLDLKKLRGKPVQGSTHEMDAWSGRGGQRIFGHYEGRVHVLDRLGKHL
jgi:putative CRISPR-associated protein (TIGR02619 family)